MSNRRKILLGLLVLPVAAGIAAMSWPNTGTELAFLFLGVPVLALNAWEFFTPGGLGPERQAQMGVQAGASEERGDIMMKNRSLIIGIIVVVMILAVLMIYAGIKAQLNETLFIREISTLFFTLGRKLWIFLTTPAVFIASLAFILGLIALRQFKPAGKTLEEVAAVQYPEAFHLPCVEKQAAGLFKRRKVEPWNGEWIDLKTVQLLLELDGIEVRKPYLLAKVQALGIRAEEMPAEANLGQREAFYWGVMDGLCADVLPSF